MTFTLVMVGLFLVFFIWGIIQQGGGLNAPRSIARWGDMMYRTYGPNPDPKTIVRDRYMRFPLKGPGKYFLELSMPQITDIFSMCRIVAHAELLCHLPPLDLMDVYEGKPTAHGKVLSAVDDELIKLGWNPQTGANEI